MSSGKLDFGNHRLHTTPIATGEISALRQAVERTRDRLLALQQQDGHWCAELQGDTIL